MEQVGRFAIATDWSILMLALLAGGLAVTTIFFAASLLRERRASAAKIDVLRRKIVELERENWNLSPERRPESPSTHVVEDAPMIVTTTIR